MDKILFVGLGAFGCKTLLSVIKSLNKRNHDASRVSVFGVGIDLDEYNVAAITGKSENFCADVAVDGESPFSYFKDEGRLSSFVKDTVISTDFPSEKIRVVIITSLAENMGKNSFIQTALALRRLLSECKVRGVIYGAFVLGNVLPAGGDRNAALANVECALGELKAVTDVKMGAVKLEEYAGDRDLYRMDEGFVDTRPVYDASFVFDANEEQMELESCVDIYVRQVSHFVISRFVSEASLTFNNNEHIDVSILGKMGKFAKGYELKLEYPAEQVLKYCTARAVNNNLLPAFDIAERELSQRGFEGANYAQEYVKVLEKQFETAEPESFVGRILEETKTVKDIQRDDLVVVHESKEKVSLLVAEIEERIGAIVESEYMNPLRDYIHDNRATSASTLEKLKDKVLFDRHRFVEFTKEAMRLSENIGETVAESLLYPDTSYEEVRQPLLFALIESYKDDGTKTCVPPAAAKYMLLKFYERCREILSVKCNMSQIDNLANDITTGQSEIWDCAAFVAHNKEQEKDYCPLDVIERRKLLMVPSAFIVKYGEAYAAFLQEEYKRCSRYLALLCEKAVLEKAMDKILVLARSISDTYSGLSEYTKEVENISAFSNEKEGDDSVVYVYATAKAKERIYRKLAINDYVGFDAINECVLKNGYTGFLANEGREACALSREELLNELVSLSWRCMKKYVVQAYSNRADYDIYGAMFRESDMCLSREALELETDAQKQTRYEDVLLSYFAKLYSMACDKLSYDDLSSSDYRKTVKTVLSVNIGLFDIARGVWERIMPKSVVSALPETKKTEICLTCQLAGVEFSELTEKN